MVVGHGDVGSALPERDDLLFFASGVSNSQEKRESEYQREIDLLLSQSRDMHLVYFSSLAVFYANTRYAKHKRSMEALVKEAFKHYTIIRLGNITWGSNPNTLINYFRNQRKEGKALFIRDEYRYIVEKEEFLHWISLIPAWNAEMNIPGRKMTVREVVNVYA